MLDKLISLFQRWLVNTLLYYIPPPNPKVVIEQLNLKDGNVVWGYNITFMFFSKEWFYGTGGYWDSMSELIIQLQNALDERARINLMNVSVVVFSEDDYLTLEDIDVNCDNWDTQSRPGTD